MNKPLAESQAADLSDSQFGWRYALLTVVIVLPLLWSFATARSVYPATAWTVMVSGGSLQQPWTYYLIRGETVSGQLIDLRPAGITDALYGRTWSMVRAAVNNDAFKLQSPHPGNLQLIKSNSEVPRAVLVPELLATWGRLYNSSLSSQSRLRLKAVRLDVYRWDSGRFQHYDNLVETWHSDL